MRVRRLMSVPAVAVGLVLLVVTVPLWAAPGDFGQFPRILAANDTRLPDSTFTGPPDDAVGDIGLGSVTYEFDCAHIYDGPGGDFNVYQVDFGLVEFYKIDVLVSANGSTFFRVTHTEGAAIRIPGDEAHDDLGFARSYDLELTGLSFVRFVMIQGEASGFDLDAIGAIHFVNTCDIDRDGVDDAIDVCHNTPTGTAVDPQGRPLGDIDLDCDTDLDDYFLLQQGFTGPLAPRPVVIATVPVGNPGNPNDTHGDGYGGVDYVYNIGKFEVTAGQYTEFLNAVAATDTYGLYDPSMDSHSKGCQITQNGTSGSYTYDFSGRPSGTEADWLERPVNYVSWGNAARFANWLHNGQPTGAQDLTTTEDGSYLLDGAMSNAELADIEREPDATWVIPSEDEWYKTAYHKNDGATGNYWDYPTASDTVPTMEAPPGTDMTNGSANYADAGYAIGSPYYRTDVGAYDSKPSDSPYGTFDQGGNAWEWNEAVPSTLNRELRGGSFGSNDSSLHAAFRGGSYPSYGLVDIGFRVAEVR